VPSRRTWTACSSAFKRANLAARVLAYACGSQAEAVAVMRKLISGLVWERAQAAR
jgi:hypothetical protein